MVSWRGRFRSWETQGPPARAGSRVVPRSPLLQPTCCSRCSYEGQSRHIRVVSSKFPVRAGARRRTLPRARAGATRRRQAHHAARAAATIAGWRMRTLARAPTCALHTRARVGAHDVESAGSGPTTRLRHGAGVTVSRAARGARVCASARAAACRCLQDPYGVRLGVRAGPAACLLRVVSRVRS